VPTYWSNHCTVDPVGLTAEYLDLLEKGVNPKIHISSNSPITTPLDIEANRHLENDNNHGSVGVGFGTTIQREEDYYSFKFLDIFYEDIFSYKMKMVKDYYLHKHLCLGVNWRQFNKSCCYIKDIFNKNIKLHVGSNVPMGYDSYIYEGAQGLLLDQNKGFFPHVTRSSTGLINISHLKEEKPVLWLVTRAYQTRHGLGPMTNETHKNNSFIKTNPHEKNKMHHWQGNFRKTILDLSLLEYSFLIHKLYEIHDRRLVITCLDNLKKYCLTYKNKDHVFKKEKDFINMISEVLITSKVYVSKSPGPNPIYEF
jgi:adenylosuccinate synthase